MTVLDALYFTVETIATVGYGDFSFAAQAPWLRAFAIALMFCGVVLAAVLFALLTELLVSTRLARSFGHRRAATTKGHVIVVGLGSIGAAGRPRPAGRRQPRGRRGARPGQPATSARSAPGGCPS